MADVTRPAESSDHTEGKSTEYDASYPSRPTR
ncbi:MAG: hypothetical protein QOJ56_4464, partial [Mycobacterium sp.]|nr:hypothetical protein [Mycobacterium sp.]